MLMLMKSQTEAMRGLAVVVGAAMDVARCHPDARRRADSQAFVDLMIPVVKGWSTETSCEVASLGVQVDGGMGYIEETGAAQHLRDARITTIYEGTTGIQALDLIGRKIARDSGAAARAVISAMRETNGVLQASGHADLRAIHRRFEPAIAALELAIVHIADNYQREVRATSVGAVPFLRLFGCVAGGWQLAHSAIAAQRRTPGDGLDAGFLGAKVLTARFYAEHVLTQAAGLAETAIRGSGSVCAVADEQL
jgi:acyl-CoA dehydrogenase